MANDTYEEWYEDLEETKDYDELIDLLKEQDIDYDEYDSADENGKIGVTKVVIYDVNGDVCTSCYFVSGVLVRIED